MYRIVKALAMTVIALLVGVGAVYAVTGDFVYIDPDNVNLPPGEGVLKFEAGGEIIFADDGQLYVNGDMATFADTVFTSAYDVEVNANTYFTTCQDYAVLNALNSTIFLGDKELLESATFTFDQTLDNAGAAMVQSGSNAMIATIDYHFEGEEGETELELRVNSAVICTPAGDVIIQLGQ